MTRRTPTPLRMLLLLIFSFLIAAPFTAFGQSVAPPHPQPDSPPVSQTDSHLVEVGIPLFSGQTVAPSERWALPVNRFPNFDWQEPSANPRLSPADFSLFDSESPAAEPSSSGSQAQNSQTPPASNDSQAPSLQDLGLSPAQTQGNAALQAKLDKRSRMLRTHQKLGLITAIPMIATVATSFGAGGRATSTSDRWAHMALGTATTGLYFSSAYFAIFAPKIPGTQARGPIRLHKALAWIHGPGMILTPVLGAIAFEQKSKGERVHGIARAHGPVAIVTAGAFAAAILSVSVKF
jgi:hypothetical protein